MLINGLTKEETMKEETMEFRPFWFEANQAWGEVNSLKEWKRILDVHKRVWSNEEISGKKLMAMAHATIKTEEVEGKKKKAREGYIPNFGLYAEHKSSMTLEDWAKNNNMYDILA